MFFACHFYNAVLNGNISGLRENNRGVCTLRVDIYSRVVKDNIAASLSKKTVAASVRPDSYIFNCHISSGSVSGDLPVREIARIVFSHFEANRNFYSLLKERGLVSLLNDIILDSCGFKPEQEMAAAYLSAEVREEIVSLLAINSAHLFRYRLFYDAFL